MFLIDMVTFYVLYDEFTRTFVRAGKGDFRTYSLNYAKHFTSEWSANRFKSNGRDFDCLTVKKIVRE